MNKPKLTQFQRFAKIALHKYERYLPTAFDESLTLLEKMNKLIEYLNLMGIQLNDVVEQWNEVMEWIVSDGITDTVLDRLDEMVDDGTLATIINEHIFNELNDKVDQKADASYVDSEVNRLNTLISQKADLDEMNEELNKRVIATTSSTDIYVTTWGDDNNNGLSVSTAFRTLEKAISVIPDVIAHDHTFRLNIGVGNFNESLEIKNKVVHGILEIKGMTEDPLSHQVDEVVLENITGHSLVSYLYVNKQYGQSFKFVRCAPLVNVSYVVADGYEETEATGTIGLLADFGSNVLVRYSSFSHKRYGIRCNYLSRVFSQSNTGVRNYNGLGSRWGGILQAYGTQPAGTNTNKTVDSGAFMIEGKGQLLTVPRDDIYMKERHRTRANGRYTDVLYDFDHVNGGTRNITENTQLAVYFTTYQYGVQQLDIEFAGMREDAAPQMFNATWNGYIGGTFIHSHSKMTVHSAINLTANHVRVVHTGNGNFKVIFNPPNTSYGGWRCIIRSKLFRPASTATISDVVIEDVE